MGSQIRPRDGDKEHTTDENTHAKVAADCSLPASQIRPALLRKLHMQFNCSCGLHVIIFSCFLFVAWGVIQCN